MNNRLFLDVHAIQTLPPSNINRDDTGSPKTAQYGGIRRARVSSQSWKRAIRSYFYDNNSIENRGIRTAKLAKLISDEIINLDPSKNEEESFKLAHDALKKVNSKYSEKIENDKGESTANKGDALFFISELQAKAIADAILAGTSTKDNLEDLLKNNNSIDIALFGRMMAGVTSLKVDASCQVAHAISTHGVQTEFDFFTALDDYNNKQGAAFLQTFEFNSSTLYRYSNIAIHELNNQLDDQSDLVNVIKLYIEAFVNSLPTGKINSFANQTLPHLVLITLRTDRPINLVTAFETPVKSKDGYAVESIEKLFQEYEKVQKFAKAPCFNGYVVSEEIASPANLIESANLDALLGELSQALESFLLQE